MVTSTQDGKARARRLWWAAGLWLGAIYSTLYVARFATEWLREHHLLRISVWTAFGLGAVAVAVWAARRRLAPAQLGVVAALAATLLLLALRLPLVEERIHLIEYGALGALVYSALREEGVRRPWLWAAVLTAAAGFGDELIQHVLPNRYFGWKDVRINALAGGLAAGALALVERLDAGRSGRPTAQRPGQ